MPALKEAPCGDEFGVDVNNLCLGQVNTMACRPYVYALPKPTHHCSIWSARQSSLRQCLRVLPECPTCTLGYSEQGIWYTPHLGSWVLGPWDGLAGV